MHTHEAREPAVSDERGPAPGAGRRGLRRGAQGLALFLLAGAALGACSSGGDDSSAKGGAPSSAAASAPTGGDSEDRGDSDGGGSPSADVSPSPPRNSSPPATATGPANSAKPSAPATADTSKEAGAGRAGERCASADMRLALGRGDAGAGNVHYSLVFTNTSGRSCTLRGYPGVSVLAGDGSQVGAPATRDGGTGSAVRLAPGGRAHTILHTLNEGTDGGCRAGGQLLRVYPPGSREAMTTRDGSLRVCGDTFTVTTIKAGAGPS